MTDEQKKDEIKEAVVVQNLVINEDAVEVTLVVGDSDPKGVIHHRYEPVDGKITLVDTKKGYVKPAQVIPEEIVFVEDEKQQEKE